MGRTTGKVSRPRTGSTPLPASMGEPSCPIQSRLPLPRRRPGLRRRHRRSRPMAESGLNVATGCGRCCGGSTSGSLSATPLLTLRLPFVPHAASRTATYSGSTGPARAAPTREAPAPALQLLPEHLHPPPQTFRSSRPADEPKRCRVVSVVRFERQPPLASRADRWFPMETPATSAASAGTMVATKRAVMIDDPFRGIALAHPSQSVRAERGRRRTRSVQLDRPVPEHAPITCSTCRMTFLPSAAPPAATSSEGWVCDLCRTDIG